MATVELSEDTLEKLGCIISDKILQAKDKPEKWIGINELSEIIGVPVSTIRYWLANNKSFPCLRGNPLRFKLSVVERWISER